MKEVKINAALNGFIIDVGCKKMVYTDISSLLKDLREYLKDWDKKEKEIYETALNKRLLGSPAPPSMGGLDIMADSTISVDTAPHYVAVTPT